MRNARRHGRNIMWTKEKIEKEAKAFADAQWSDYSTDIDGYEEELFERARLEGAFIAGAEYIIKQLQKEQ